MAPVITEHSSTTTKLGQTKKSKRKNKNKQGRRSSGPTDPMASPPSPIQLLTEATELLQANSPQQALTPANAALASLQASRGTKSPLLLPALSLIGEIQLELGDTAGAYTTFQTAASIDPDGKVPEAQGGGADKFLYLAQLDEAGGRASLAWFEKAVDCLEREYFSLETKARTNASASAEEDEQRTEKRTKLAHALCGMCELWMTDLSYDDATAEDQCEKLITQAVLLQPDDAQTLQTLASIRLSQKKLDDARAALERSLELWVGLPPGHPAVPEFAARIQLARTLMEAGMESDALDVCERLVGEEDQSVEAWYLGGWCQHLMATAGEADGAGEVVAGNDKDAAMGGDDKGDEEKGEDESEVLGAEDRKALLLSSREWLRNCLRLCQMLDYEDDRLRDHAKELVEMLDKALGDAEIEVDEEEGWEGIQSDENDSDSDDGEGQDKDEEMDES